MKQLQQPIRPQDNFVPMLSLRRKWDYFINKLHLSPLQYGSDDLDKYEAVLLELDGRRFLLLRYERYPDDMVDVFIPAKLEKPKRFLKKIVSELEVPGDAVTWLRA